MARYINLDELLNAIDKRNGRLPLWLDEILMEDCKVAFVAPVKHGHWKKGKSNERLTERGFIHDYKYICSCCGWDCCCETKLDFSFCPNCGAKMDGGEEK